MAAVSQATRDMARFGLLFLRKATGRNLSLQLGITYGSLAADSTGGAQVSAPLLQGQFGAEYLLRPGAPFSPVLALNAGAYRIRTDSGFLKAVESVGRDHGNHLFLRLKGRATCLAVSQPFSHLFRPM